MTAPIPHPYPQDTPGEESSAADGDTPMKGSGPHSQEEEVRRPTLFYIIDTLTLLTTGVQHLGRVGFG